MLESERRSKMEFVTGVKKKETLELSELLEAGRIGTEVRVNGAIHTIRDMGTVAFIILRKREGLVQCVYEEGVSKFSLKDVKEADTVEVSGMLEQSEKAPNGIEIRLGELKILSEPAEPMPLPISKWKLNTSLEAKLNYRPISLRNIRERAKFRIQEGIVRGFRDFLYQEGFTEIHTPKIGAKSAEGGANLFRLEYFHRPAILQQSPQFYKQMMVGVFDRVFETAPVFRAEKHNTKRHLNEYTSLDFEMGYIDGFEDIMAMETGFLQYTMTLLEKEYARELKILNIQDLQLSCILFFKQGHRILKKSGLHCHDIFKSVDISHFKIQAGVFVEVSLGIMLFCTEYRSSFKYTVKNSHHHLLIKLRALLEDRRSVEIFQPEEVCSSLRTFRTNLRSMDLCKSFLIKEIPEPSYDSFLNPEFCTLSDISQRNWSVI